VSSKHLPGLLNSAAMDKAVRTTKSFSALFSKRNAPDPPALSPLEETAAMIPLPTLDKSSELGLTLRPVR
jgi:hypothetical protein